jgi:hypothetical protein
MRALTTREEILVIFKENQFLSFFNRWTEFLCSRGPGLTQSNAAAKESQPQCKFFPNTPAPLIPPNRPRQLSMQLPLQPRRTKRLSSKELQILPEIIQPGDGLSSLWFGFVQGVGNILSNGLFL